MSISSELLARLKDPELLIAKGYVGGKWVAEAKSGKTFEVSDPATGAVLARPYAEAWIAEALLSQDQPNAALSRLLEVRRFTVKSGERYYDAELLRLSALATGAARPGAMRQVRTLLDKAASHARRTGIDLHLSNALIHFQGLPAL